MAIPVTCPACKQKFKVPEQYAGRKGRCPKCKEIFRAPELKKEKEEEELAGDDWLVDEELPPPPPPEEEAAALPRISRGEGRGSSADVDLNSLLGSVEESPLAESPLPGPLPGPVSGARRGKAPAEPVAEGKSKGGGLPVWVWAAVGGGALAALILGVGLVVILAGGGDEPEVGVTEPADAGEEETPGETPSEEPSEEQAEALPDLPDPEPASDALKQAWQNLRTGVVELTIRGSGGTRKVNGFIVDESGVVAAPYHEVAAPDTQQITALVDDLSFPIEGVVAANRKTDLALLQLDLGIPISLTALELAPASPQTGQSVYAAGKNSSELKPVVVARILQNRELPQSARAVLREWQLDEQDPLTWIQTSSPPPADAIGGPLLNAEGKVVGVIAQLSPSSPSGYAIDAQQLAVLLDHRHSEPLTLISVSFAQLTDELPGAAGRPGGEEVAAADSVTAGQPGEPDEGTEVLPEAGDPEGDEIAASDGTEAPPASPSLTGESIQKALQMCDSFDFAPTSEVQYEWLQLLSIYVDQAEETLERQPDAVPSAMAAEIREAVQQAIDQLADVAFTDEERIKAVNQFAREVLQGEPHEQVYFYARVSLDRDDFNQSSEPVVMLALEGPGDQVYLPVSQDTINELTTGSRLLVMGSYTGRWGFSNDLGTTKQVPAVVGRYVIVE